MEGKNWADLTPVEKREQRYRWWLKPDVKFVSPEAEKKYKERTLRFIQAYRVCCISGNVPSSLVVTGEYAMVKDYCRKLIETCAPGGGFILAGGAQVDEGNPENLRAMLEAAKEYGKY